ncbi:MAG: hypothetical protein EAX96_06655 [Candidatus Lokiarchaeota archaeon]|nr:hypothetical protein [Candidatus Lokiarchaeota archaeon]
MVDHIKIQHISIVILYIFREGEDPLVKSIFWRVKFDFDPFLESSFGHFFITKSKELALTGGTWE